MEQTRNTKMARNSRASSVWKRSVMATSVAAVLACVGMPAFAQKVSCDGGQSQNSPGQDWTACGAHAVIAGNDASAFGSYAEATAAGATAIGHAAKAQATNSLALGVDAIVDATAVGSIALGAGSHATGLLSTPGYLTGTTATRELAIGDRRITGLADGSVNSDAATIGQLKALTSVGWQLGVDGDATTQQVKPAEAVLFKAGTNATVTRADKTIEVGVRNDPTFTGLVTAKGGLSVASGGLTVIGVQNVSMGGSVVHDVGAGTAPTDAVNFGQLSIVGKSVAGALGGASTYDPLTQTVKADLSVGGKNYTDVDTALDAVDAKASQGWNVTDANGNTANIGPDGNVMFQSANPNLTVTQKGADDNGVVEVKLAEDLKLGVGGSVTMGDTLVDARGLIITNGPSVTATGIDAGGKKITNVAIGDISAGSTDAVNGSQLAAVEKAANAGWNVTDAGGNTANIGSNGKVTFLSPDTNLTVAQKGADDNGVVEVKLAEDLKLGVGGSVTMGDTLVDARGLIITNGPSVTATGIDAGGKKITVTLAGANGAGTRIGNVAPGELGASSMDAINGSQLFQSMTQVAAMLGGGASMTAQGFTAPSYLIQNATYNDVGSALHALDIAVTNIDGRPPFGKNDLEGYTHGSAGGYTPYGEGGASSTALGVNAHATGVEDAVAVGESATVGAEYGTALGQNASVTAEGAVALGHDSVADRAGTVSVGSAGAERQVVNVADATQGTDAINKRQLDRGVASANSYTDARVNALSDSFDLFQGAVDERLRRQDRRIDRQGAMNAAMMNMAMSAAGIHTENRVGVGIGFQGGQSAMSLGYQRALSERATITFGGAFSSDDSSVGLGAGFGW